MADVTRLIDAAVAGDTRAADQLLPIVYDELRRLAAARLAGEAAGQTLDATGLVHEAYLRLIGDQQFSGRRHFFAAAAEAMRRILVEGARRRRAIKRGGGLDRRDVAAIDLAAPTDGPFDLDLDAALDRLTAEHPLKAEVVKLRYFAGLTLDEIAAALDISPATADRWWAYARSWLRIEVGRLKQLED